MGVIDSLVALLNALSPDEVNIASDVDITLGGDDVDIEQIEGSTINVKSGTEGPKISIEQDRVVLYPDELQGDEYALFTQLTRAVKREAGRVDRFEEHRQTQALENSDKEYIDETIAFFDGLLSRHYIQLLRSCLYLRQITENSDWHADFNINQQKRELRERYGYETYYVAHLVSSGYFDEGRYFRTLFRELKVEYDDTAHRYQEEFERTVGEKLLAVFVSSDDEPVDVKQDVRATIAKHIRHQPRMEFIDVCGVGKECQRIINTFVRNMEEEHPTMEYENRDRGEERVIRLYPGTL